MPKKTTCPACGAVGELAPCDNKVFSVQGRAEGKTVVECLKCGNGLLVGPFSGGFLGKPQVIPPAAWAQMKAWKAQQLGKR